MDTHFRSCLRDPCSCDLKRYWLILALTVVILILELAGGLISGSLALLSDAGHVLGDTLAIGVAIIAERAALRDPSKKKRARIVGAFLNGLIIICMSALIAFEAWRRLSKGGQEILTGPMIAVAAVGALGNYLQAVTLGHADHDHVGRQAVRLHILSDLWQSLAVIAGGIIIWLTGWWLIDPIVSWLIAAMMTIWAVRLLNSIRKSP